MNATEQAIQEADEIWCDYELPPGAKVAATNGWEDDGQGELVMKVFMGFNEAEPGAPSERAHFVVSYDTNTGALKVGDDAELRLTSTGAVLGHPGVPVRAIALR